MENIILPSNPPRVLKKELH
ncbi:unnamed protein product [Lathyrus sativus]|nr:unnamed protein product [Lathyrus sativus]